MYINALGCSLWHVLVLANCCYFVIFGSFLTLNKCLSIPGAYKYWLWKIVLLFIMFLFKVVKKKKYKVRCLYYFYWKNKKSQTNKGNWGKLMLFSRFSCWSCFLLKPFTFHDIVIQWLFVTVAYLYSNLNCFCMLSINETVTIISHKIGNEL